ncbi:9415_t:CDS:2, partial [Acaulospora colombiana]
MCQTLASQLRGGAAGHFGPNHVLRDSLPAQLDEIDTLVDPFALSQYEEPLSIMEYPLENETDPRRLAREVIRTMMGIIQAIQLQLRSGTVQGK